jgi:hypothetical protein
MTKQWTPVQDHEMVELYELGYSAAEIATKLRHSHGGELSRNAVVGRLHRLGKTRDKGIAQPQAEGPKARRVKAERLGAKIYRERCDNRLAGVVVAELASGPPSAFGQVGVRYHDNVGCSAIIHDRDQDGFKVCCGRPFCLDLQGRRSMWCKGHFNLFVRRTRNDREYLYGKASSFG